MSNPALEALMFAGSQQLAVDNASFAFGKPIGSEYGLGYIDTTFESRALGICGIRTMLTVGDTNRGFDAPINKAARSLYTKYWEKNSSISKFQPQDITIYTYGSAQCIALLGWLTTIYGVRKIANPNSEYARTALWYALGVNPADITLHLTDLRGYINQKLIDLQNVRLDKSIPLYLYADNMYKHIYMDNPNTSKTQYYVTRPGKVLKYVKDGSGIGSLTYDSTLDVDNPNLTYAQLCTFIDSVWADFFNSAYIADISAAIGKADVATWTCAELNDAYEVKPYFDARALMRYKNASVPLGITATDITQDVINQLVQCKITAWHTDTNDFYDGTAEQYRKMWKSNQFLHAFSAKTQTPQESIVTGSLMVSGVEEQPVVGEYQLELREFGYELIDGVVIYCKTAAGILSLMPFNSITHIRTSDHVSGFNKALRIAEVAKEFEFLPVLRVYVDDDDMGSGDECLSTVVDTDDYVVLTREDLYKLHRACIFAILGVPAEG